MLYYLLIQQKYIILNEYFINFRMKYIIGVFFKLLSILFILNKNLEVHANEVIGCGGFIKSNTEINYKIIKVNKLIFLIMSIFHHNHIIKDQAFNS